MSKSPPSFADRRRRARGGSSKWTRRNEKSLSPACNGDTGANCTIVPPTDDNGAPATFYPYYSSGHALGGCAWTVGQDYPGFSTNDYGKLHQYGSLLKVTYPTQGGGTVSSFNDFQKFVRNPCPAP